MKYWDEFTHLVFLAIAFSLFVIGFTHLGKIVAAKSPLPSGFKQALAS